VFPNMEDAKAAADKLAQGTSFAALAAERQLKDSDIDLGTVAKPALVDRDVADAAFALKAGEVSAPVQGRFGIAIIRVESIEPGTTRPLEEVATELKHDLQAERAKNEVTNVQEKVEDERLGGATLGDAVRKFNLSPRTIDAVDRSGKNAHGSPVPDLPKNVDVLAAAFGADVHGENEPLRLPDRGGYVWFDVDAITPAHDQTLDEVKDRVVTHWRDDQITARLKTKATEMLDKLKAGTAFADVAAPEGLKAEWRPGIKRDAPAPGLSAAAVADIFKTPKDGAGSVEGANPTDRIVFRVTEIKVPPLDPQSADSKRIDEALKNRAADELLAQYLASLQSDIGVSINASALNQVTGGAQN
jgi:peptidyl-prolyl cis-trans isomerase D